MKRFQKVERENRKNRGEVFTPPLLAEEMINTIPELNIDDKILDPCSGATCVFPIMMMFRYVKQFGREHLSTYINECIYMCEINPLAADYSEVILMRYVRMLQDTDVENVKQHYIDNYQTIINDYYEFCDFSEVGV
ncbi:N-6 DNA methylase [Aquipluma nitroreducens]|uniref:N-6 DNA methylase n=1 Tax=Aquipluma nitroreducens TaxID=2010828 RepID=UPI00296E36D1|nr:N-6 DNA methylase [Aquipluma nitroreducens]